MIIKLNEHNLVHEIAALGVHPASVGIFASKSRIIPLKITAVRTPAANILKQEMLAAGGDCAVPANCILNNTERMDVVLLGTVKHYRILERKLAQMNFFGLAALQKELQTFLAGQQPVTVLADGRKITYEKMRIMGILNVTPDSFSDGGKYQSVDLALKQAERMIEEGAAILDIGGESTRPGHKKITDQEEIERVVPVIEAVKKNFDIAVSLDTYKYEVSKAGIAAGADMINDIWGLKWDERLAPLLAKEDVACCLMHNRDNQEYTNFIEDFCSDMEETLAIAKKAGIRDERIVLDPGVGFGKTFEQNLSIMKHMDVFSKWGLPVLLGTSRKSVIGLALNLPVDQREEGTAATTVLGRMKGASIFRVHDVKTNYRELKMIEAILEAE